jgi:hypothetical protein
VAGLTHVLIPGRHHALTRFQAQYLHQLVNGVVSDTDGVPIRFASAPTLVWAITSANHQNTRRNPVPANRREVAIELFSLEEGFRSLVVPVFDTRPTDRFAEITLKAITAGADGLLLGPSNCVVAVSTPSVIELYRKLGFRIAAVELNHIDAPLRAWQVLQLCAAGDPVWRDHAHRATTDVFARYGLARHVAMVLGDPVVGDEGSLTETRDYRAYAASFEASAARKWAQARPYVVPGRIVDIGCAAGAILELAAKDPELQESDLFGIEVAQHLFEECVHKKSQGVFANPNTFFFQRNILSGRVFADASINTSLTFALTHEIVSYAGGIDALKRMVTALFAQAAPGGVWINSDVCGPDEGDRDVVLRFREPGLDRAPRDLERLQSDEAKSYLDQLTPAARFRQFAVDFGHLAHVAFRFDQVDANSVRLSLRDAMEFMSKFTYTDSWLSECHERFCALDWRDWEALVQAAGFDLDPRSGPWRNEWMVANRFQPAAELTTPTGEPLPWPSTHVFMVAVRPLTDES